MRFLFLILISVQFSAVSASTAAAAAASFDSQSVEHFPNYFRYLDYDVYSPLFTDPDTGEQSRMSSAHGHHLGEYAINKALVSILNRLEIPYIDVAGNKQTKGFFRELLRIARTQDPNVKLYLFGGVVRSLLGYIYKKLHNAHLKAQAELKRPLTHDELKTLVKKTFVIIINGISYEKYDAYLADKKSDPALAFNKDLPNFSVLGVGSDLDIVYSSTIPGFDKKLLEDFIKRTRAEIKVQDRSEEEDFINSFLPKADVLKYEEQLKNSMEQGGSSLDWLAFPIDGNQLIIPGEYPDILRDFMHGIYRYVPPPSGTKASTKQTVRGLRPLLELPFLKLDTDSQKQLESELENLGSVDQKNVDKLVRNARYGAANNRLTEGEDKLVSLIKKSTSLKIPIFLKSTPIATRVVKNPSIDNLLMPRTEFEEKYTQNGILLHGTKSLNNVLYMVRNGLFTSQSGQGTSAFGPGVYTTPNVSRAKGYAGDQGIILEFPLNPSPNLRIVEYADSKDTVNDKIKDLQQKNESLEQFFFRLVRDYDIDIIVNNHVLIQNADAVRPPQKALDFIRTILIDTERTLQSPNLTKKDHQKIYDVLYTDKYTTLLALLAPGESERLKELKLSFIRMILVDAERTLQSHNFTIDNLQKIYDLLYTDKHRTLLVLLEPGELERFERLKGEFTNFLRANLEKGKVVAPLFLIKNKIEGLSKIAKEILEKKFLEKCGLGISADTLLTFMETGCGLNSTHPIADLLRREHKWETLELIYYMFIKEPEILDQEQLVRKIDSLLEAYDGFGIFDMRFLPLITKRFLESEHPVNFLDTITQFQTTGNQNAEALAEVLQIQNADEREDILNLCLQTFSRDTGALQKKDYIFFFKKFGKDAKRILDISTKFLTEEIQTYNIGTDRLKMFKIISTLPKDFNLKGFLEKIKPYLEGLPHQRFDIFEILLFMHLDLDEIFQQINDIFPENKKDLGEFFGYLKKNDALNNLKFYLNISKPFLINKDGNNFYFLNILKALLKFDTPPLNDVQFILDIFRQEKSNNLSVALMLEALHNHPDKKLVLEKVKKLIDLIPKKEYLTFMILNFLKLPNIEAIDRAIQNVKNAIERITDETERNNFIGQDAQKLF